ncbi:spermatogenesis-defective protein 39 homolog [Hippocampus zosterae]|uniref:spermatogenesis-defective protein 39 homolog n=1 Tax=Hippocampus zosterae TaxID=109293 RepID=UPI00223DFADE|nr:spermatogenesis-defective protein 39 homolog [Hippocampus zosterae]
MMKSRGDEEEYWNTSKFKAFTFDDDDDELKESKEAVKSLPQLSDQDESDLVEKVSWSGEPVGSISWSVRETAAAAGGGAADGGPAFPSRIPDDASNVAKANSGYSLSSLFKGRRSFAAFADASGDPSGRILAPEIPKPKSEKQDLIGDWSPQDAVKRMQQGKAVSLERFRCLQDKMRLLDWSVATHDGNVITAVLISLKKSLSKEVLIGELASRQTALRHFLNYLSESGDEALLADVYSALGRTEDAALLRYKRHLSIADEEKRRDFLKGCLSLQFCAEDRSQVRDQLSLLERQMLIEEADRQAERGGKAEIFQRFPRRASIPHMPLITTLYYCCFYHYDQPEGSFSSPLNIRHSFKISEKQFFVTALSARAKQKSWSDVDALFTSRSWLGFTRKKSPLAFQKVVDILHRNGAPVQVLQDYVGLVDDAEARMALAHQHKCHDLVINTYRDAKDRRLLLGYRGKVEAGSAAERKIDQLLNDSQIRWKN